MARTPLFQRLPDIWKRLDALPDGSYAMDSLLVGMDRQDVSMDGVRRGVLERYLGVLDAGFDRSHGMAKAVLDFRSVDRVPDRYLALLADIVGHQWRSDKSHDWNRSRIRDAVRRYSYKGTAEAVRDLAREYGSDTCDITDMASKLIVLNLQGDLDTDNAHFPDADVYHAGAFVLKIDMMADLAAFREELDGIVAAGTRWYLRIEHQGRAVSEDVCTFRVAGRVQSTNANNYGLGEGLLDESLWLPPLPGGDSRSFGQLTMADQDILMDRDDITMDMFSWITMDQQYTMDSNIFTMDS